jgi:hypothetical protein
MGDANTSDHVQEWRDPRFLSFGLNPVERIGFGERDSVQALEWRAMPPTWTASLPRRSTAARGAIGAWS